MSRWICCNCCFQAPGPDRKLAITTCGHVICSLCYQKGKQGECMICKTKCQVNPLSDESSAEVKALFSDINTVATKHFTEISKVLLFQARHQKRLMAHYQKRNEKLEEACVKLKQEMQQMSKKLSEQGAYITKLENTLQQQRAKTLSSSQFSHSSHSAGGSKSVLQIPYTAPMSLSRHSSTTSLVENMEVDGRSLFKKPEICGNVPRVSLISPPQDGHIGTAPYRPASQNNQADHAARSATVRRLQEPPPTPDLLYHGTSGWDTPVFKHPSAFRGSSLSLLASPSLVAPRPQP